MEFWLGVLIVITVLCWVFYMYHHIRKVERERDPHDKGEGKHWPFRHA